MKIRVFRLVVLLATMWACRVCYADVCGIPEGVSAGNRVSAQIFAAHVKRPQAAGAPSAAKPAGYAQPESYGARGDGGSAGRGGDAAMAGGAPGPPPRSAATRGAALPVVGVPRGGCGVREER